MQLKRLTYHVWHRDLNESKDGELVLFSEVEALQKRCEELEEALLLSLDTCHCSDGNCGHCRRIKRLLPASAEKGQP